MLASNRNESETNSATKAYFGSIFAMIGHKLKALSVRDPVAPLHQLEIRVHRTPSSKLAWNIIKLQNILFQRIRLKVMSTKYHPFSTVLNTWMISRLKQGAHKNNISERWECSCMKWLALIILDFRDWCREWWALCNKPLVDLSKPSDAYMYQ